MEHTTCTYHAFCKSLAKQVILVKSMKTFLHITTTIRHFYFYLCSTNAHLSSMKHHTDENPSTLCQAVLSLNPSNPSKIIGAVLNQMIWRTLLAGNHFITKLNYWKLHITKHPFEEEPYNILVTDLFMAWLFLMLLLCGCI